MPYLVLKTVTVQNEEEESYTHLGGSVISDWEVSDFVKERIAAGEIWYRSTFEPLTENEAHHQRTKATAAEGQRYRNGQQLDPPWDDYVGLHPNEIMRRMQALTDVKKVEAVKDYERAGMNRTNITGFTTSVEREPFAGYTGMATRDILEKMAVLSEPAIQSVIVYEKGHQNRPAIVEYEREVFEPQTAQVAAA